MITIINYMLCCITIGATKLITTRVDGVCQHCKKVHKKCYTAVFGVIRLIQNRGAGRSSKKTREQHLKKVHGGRSGVY